MDDKFKRRLYEELSKGVSPRYIGNSYDAIAVVLRLLETPEQYGIAILPTGKMSRWQPPIDTEALRQETKQLLREYVDTNKIWQLDIHGAISDMVDVLSRLGVFIVDTRKKYE